MRSNFVRRVRILEGINQEGLDRLVLIVDLDQYKAKRFKWVERKILLDMIYKNEIEVV